MKKPSKIEKDNFHRKRERKDGTFDHGIDGGKASGGTKGAGEAKEELTNCLLFNMLFLLSLKKYGV